MMTERTAEGQIINGDALIVLKNLPTHSVDSIVTDPPGGIFFMGKEWDSDKGGRDQWIAWLASIMQEARRVIKPGGHALVWSLPRTAHWTAIALEDAGWEIRDSVHHIFGSGMPKSHNISKAVESEIVKQLQLKGIVFTSWEDEHE
jgi:site-specific DNA-methyltransferase (adenine-specific)